MLVNSIILIVMIVLVSYIDGAPRKFHLWRYGEEERKICPWIKLRVRRELRNIKVATCAHIHVTGALGLIMLQLDQREPQIIAPNFRRAF